MPRFPIASARPRLRSLLIDKLSVGGRSALEQVNSLSPASSRKHGCFPYASVVEARYEATLKASAPPSAAVALNPLRPAPPAVTGAAVPSASSSVTTSAGQPVPVLPVDGPAQSFPLAPIGNNAGPPAGECCRPARSPVLANETAPAAFHHRAARQGHTMNLRARRKDRARHRREPGIGARYRARSRPRRRATDDCSAPRESSRRGRGPNSKGRRQTAGDRRSRSLQPRRPGVWPGPLSTSSGASISSSTPQAAAGRSL